MSNRRDIAVVMLGGGLVVSALTAALATHPQFFSVAPRGSTADDALAIRMPSLDQMCAAQGAGTGDALKACEADESAAGEYVVAWMGLQGFIANGGIDLDQIALAAQLDEVNPLIAPSLEPLVGGTPDIDPVTGEAVPGSFQSAAEVALFCLMGSTDWIMLQQCIAQNDAGAAAGRQLVDQPSEIGAP